MKQSFPMNSFTPGSNKDMSFLLLTVMNFLVNQTRLLMSIKIRWEIRGQQASKVQRYPYLDLTILMQLHCMVLTTLYIYLVNEFNFLGPPLLPSFNVTNVINVTMLQTYMQFLPPPPKKKQLARELGHVRTTHHAWHVSCQ